MKKFSEMNFKKQFTIITLQRDALLEYLTFCNLINEVPRNEIFLLIKGCTNEQVLRETIADSKAKQEYFKKETGKGKTEESTQYIHKYI